MPQFMLILHDNPSAFEANIGPAEIQSILEEYRSWGQRMVAQGRIKGRNKLKEDGGKHMTLVQGKVRTVDGPYAEAKEVVGGYYVIEADDYAHAVKLCEAHPHLKYGSKIEVREVDPV